MRWVYPRTKPKSERACWDHPRAHIKDIHYIPLTTYSIMDFGAFTSRGESFERILKGNLFKTVVIKGGKLEKLTRELCAMIDRYEPIWKQLIHLHPNIAYVGAGVPNITDKVKYSTWRGKYEEVVMTWSDSDYERLQSEYRLTEQILKTKGVTPVFCTIAPMDLKNWNEHRNTPQGRNGYRATDYLIHQSEYPRMQFEQVQVITRMNEFIRQINRENDVLDLDLAKFVMIPREGCTGRAEQRYKVSTGYAKFVDGCHATPRLARQWSMHAAVVASDNRKRLSSAETLRIANLPSDEFDIIGVPLHKSTLRLTIPGLK